MYPDGKHGPETSAAIRAFQEKNGLVPTVIAMDGIAVIVSNDNAMNCLSSEEVRDIYMGVITEWDEINEHECVEPAVPQDEPTSEEGTEANGGSEVDG